MPKNIFAWTAEGVDLPAFVSINETDAGGFELIVWSPKEFGGQTTQVRLTKDLFDELAMTLISHEG